MPIYEYRCDGCEAVVEKIRSRPLEAIECPECGREAKRAVSLFASSASGGACSAPVGSGFG